MLVGGLIATTAWGGSTLASTGGRQARVASGEGSLVGVIIFVGGPPRTKRSPSAGWVHVLYDGRAVALVRVRERHHFDVLPPAGSYEVTASQTRAGTSLGCERSYARVHAGRETRIALSVGCLVP